MIGIDVRAARSTWTVVLILLLVWIVYLVRETLFAFAAALLFAYLLWPLVHFLDRRMPGRSRTPALAIVYAALVLFLVLGGFAIASRIVVEANALATKLPDLLANLEGPATPISAPGMHSLKDTIISAIRSQVDQRSQDIFSLLSGAGLKALAAVQNLLFLILVPILSFFFVKDGGAIRDSLLGLADQGSQREVVEEIVEDLHLLLAQYMRALLLLALVAFVAYAVFLSAIAAPYALLLAAIAFPLEFIPVVGPLVAVVLMVFVTVFSGSHDWLWIIAFAAIFRIFQDYVLSPRLLSSGTELHPLLVIFGVLAGGQIAGIAGSLFSVPIMATLRIVYYRLRKRARVAPGDLSPPISATTLTNAP